MQGQNVLRLHKEPNLGCTLTTIGQSVCGEHQPETGFQVGDARHAAPCL